MPRRDRQHPPHEAESQGPGATVVLATGQVVHLQPAEVVRRIAPRNVRIQVG
jgi:hypothetical protein